MLRALPLLIALLLAIAGTPATARAPHQRSRGCTTDDLIHAEVGDAITRQVTALVQAVERGAVLRDAARLRLPCGYHVEQGGMALLLTDGHDHRAYRENNPFGFAPAYGFGAGPAAGYTLRFELVQQDDIHPDACVDVLRRYRAVRLCSSFGDTTRGHVVTGSGIAQRLALATIDVGGLHERLAIADIHARVLALSFLPPPDAPGGTLTLVIAVGDTIYRVYLDSPGS